MDCSYEYGSVMVNFVFDSVQINSIITKCQLSLLACRHEKLHYDLTKALNLMSMTLT